MTVAARFALLRKATPPPEPAGLVPRQIGVSGYATTRGTFVASHRATRQVRPAPEAHRAALAEVARRFVAQARAAGLEEVAVRAEAMAVRDDLAPAELHDLIREALAAARAPEPPAAPEPAAPPTEPAPSGPPTPEEPSRVAAAAAEAQEPTPAQAEAGNYRKGHLHLHGLDISIENARGSTRAGTGPGGETWSAVMPAAYGDIKGTEGADGDPVDVYLTDAAEDPARPVFVVDQMDPATGRFDEHKAVLGATDEAEALAIYDGGFSDGSGPARRVAVTPMTLDLFKAWLESGRTRDPIDPDASKAHVAGLSLRRDPADIEERLARLAARRDPDGVEAPAPPPLESSVPPEPPPTLPEPPPRRRSFDAAVDDAAEAATTSDGFTPEAVAERWSGGDVEDVLDRLHARAGEFVLRPDGVRWLRMADYLAQRDPEEEMRAVQAAVAADPPPPPVARERFKAQLMRLLAAVLDRPPTKAGTP